VLPEKRGRGGLVAGFYGCGEPNVALGSAQMGNC
jgi:hypothetical protein